jgi:hypothetical protein
MTSSGKSHIQGNILPGKIWGHKRKNNLYDIPDLTLPITLLRLLKIH